MSLVYSISKSQLLLIYFKQRLLLRYSTWLLNPNLNICLNAPNTVLKFANLSSLITLPQFVFECFCLNAYKSIIFSVSYILNLIDVIHTLSVIPSFPHVSNLDWCWNTSNITWKSAKFLSLEILPISQPNLMLKYFKYCYAVHYPKSLSYPILTWCWHSSIIAYKSVISSFSHTKHRLMLEFLKHCWFLKFLTCSFHWCWNSSNLAYNSAKFLFF